MDESVVKKRLHQISLLARMQDVFLDDQEHGA
jgi:hypothetical protein